MFDIDKRKKMFQYGIFGDMWNGLTGSTDNEAKAIEEANKRLVEAKSNIKSAEQLGQAGRAAAGQAAADKAGIAKKQAKAASMMQNVGKLKSAIAGSSAAADASAQGYSEASENAANREQTAEQQRYNAEKDIASNIVAKGEAEDERTRKNRANLVKAAGDVTEAVGDVASLLKSDGNCKNIKKHTYISKEERK